MSAGGSVVVVAGVGSGLGSAVVGALASEGNTVVGWARGAGSLEALRAHAQARGWRFHPRQVDLREQGQVDAAVQAAVSELGRIDGFALTAGHWLGGATRLHELDEREWSEALADNLEPAFRSLRRVLPVMMAQHHGSVVLVSAAEGVRRAGSASYAAAKAGLIELTYQLAGECRPHGIRVNAVLPGNMGRWVALDPPDLRGPVPLRTESASAPWEVARCVRFLLSDESRWITGAAVPVDGGLSTRGAQPPG